MKNPNFELYGKLTCFKKHDDDTYFLIVVYRSKESDKNFSYTMKKHGILPAALERELENLPVVRITGLINSTMEDDGMVKPSLIATNFDILKSVKD